MPDPGGTERRGHASCKQPDMRALRATLCGLVIVSFAGIATANNDDDGFVWIDANTRIKIKPVGTAASGASASEKAAPEKAPKKEEKKEKPRK